MKAITQNMTMQDLADLAGVSIATVSRVFNESDKVSASTREKILKLADENNFQLNETARTMAAGKSRLIAVVLPDVLNPFFALLLHLLEELCIKNDYSMFFFNSNGDSEKEKEIVRKMGARQVDGMLIAMTKSQSDTVPLLKDAPFPVVAITRAMSEIDSVGINHSEGGKLAAEYLLGKKVEKFCYFGLEKDEKFTGFREQLLQNGISEDRIQIIGNQDWYFKSIESGVMILRNFVRNNLGSCKTGLFCINDMYAVHALTEATENGISVPDELSVVGFDDTFICGVSSPKLTSIHQPMEEIARYAFDILLHKMNSKSQSEAENEVITLSPKLAIRES